MKKLLHAIFLFPAVAVVITLFPIAYLLAALRVCWTLANDMVKETTKHFNGDNHGF